MPASVWGLDAASYVRHGLHGEDCAWVEKNCYVDVWIELLHAAQLDPLPLMAFTLAVDFEGDQWTFFKPSHSDLLRLYGIDTQELAIWRPLVDHAVEHVAAGKLLLLEADAYYLPDTQGTDYRTQHTKTTIGIETIDLAARKLGYFHNAGYFALEGADFAALFRLDAPPDPTYMPLFCEFVRVDRTVRRSASELLQIAKTLLGEHLAHQPAHNPFQTFRPRFERDLEWLKSEGLARYHAYAFASIRQCGASFELAAHFLRWLQAQGEPALSEAAAHCDNISSQAKSLILKAARAVNAKRAVVVSDQLDSMERSYAAIMETLVPRFGAPRL
jgi:hypothetical protein